MSEEKEVFELSTDRRKTGSIDPVCRMLILNTQNAIQHPEEEELYFCSTECLEKYKANQRLV